ncbi:hypothetical protein AHiyo8_08340 [Arthrobacter sp. Hiyo8]|nr:hypothetical protein AHiyo8_08340 [Arthrobacter sp. Hiyo8]
MAARKEVSLQPTLAQVFGQDFHDPASRRDMVLGHGMIAGPGRFQEATVGGLEDSPEPVAVGFVRAEEPEPRIRGRSDVDIPE